MPRFPAKFLCPICCDLLEKPVQLPCCHTVCCLACLQNGLELATSFCFFCRKRLLSFRRLSGSRAVNVVLEAEIKECFPGGRSGTSSDDDCETLSGAACYEKPAVIPPAPGELKQEADKLHIEFQAERDREAELGETLAMQLQREHTELLQRLECQAAEDKRVAEALRREHFNRLRQRYLQASQRPRTLLDTFVRKRSRKPLVCVDSASEVTSGSEDDGGSEDVVVMDVTTPRKAVIPAMFAVALGMKSSDTPPTRASSGTSFTKSVKKRQKPAQEPKAQKPGTAALGLDAWFRHSGKSGDGSDNEK